MELLIVIVNYRSSALVSDALESLIPELEQLQSCHVVVVDNASGDDALRVPSELLNRDLRVSFHSLKQPRTAGSPTGTTPGLREVGATDERLGRAFCSTEGRLVADLLQGTRFDDFMLSTNDGVPAQGSLALPAR